MGKRKVGIIGKLTATALLLSSLASAPIGVSTTKAAEAAEASVKLRILETTDVHGMIMDYDYYQDKPTIEHGLARTAQLIKQAREEQPNNLLFDNGDLLQGNPLTDYVAKVKGLGQTEVHPIYKVLNLLGYDAATLGNHEFNYGLPFLENAMEEAEFPFVSANIYNDDKDNDDTNDVNRFKPYTIINKEVVDEAGNKQTIKVGVIGLVTPQIMQWDKGHLEGKVKTKDIVAEAEKFVPQMKAEGADIVVALAHTGYDDSAQAYTDAENAVAPLSKVAGIDAILFGHKHVVFPGFTGTNIDSTKGTINGVAAVEAGNWGNNLGVIDLTLEKVDGKWKVSNSQSAARPIFKSEKIDGKTIKTPLVTGPDAEIVEAIKDTHEGTLEYVRGKIGVTSAPMYSFFSRVQDDPTIQIVNNAQTWYVEKYINEKLPEYKGVPVLSAGAPFKAGRQGPSDYTNIATGDLSIKSANDLYLYPNTLKAVELTGAQVKEWLEMSAGQFNQLDPKSTEAQELINYDFQTFNFDVIDGVKYEIDVTQPARYDLNGTLVNEKANRIKNLTMPNGTPVKADQKFVVVTNNYRASGGGNFPGLVGGKAKLVVDSADENRQILMDYISAQGTINPSADKNWRITPFNEKAKVTFNSAPEMVKEVLDANNNITFVETTSDGWGKYQIDLGKPAKVETTFVVNTVKNYDKKVTGKAPIAKGNTVTVKAGSKVLGTDKSIDKNGNFSVTLKAAQKAGTVLTVVVTNKDGKILSSKKVTVQDKIAPKAPSAGKLKASSEKLTGKAEAYSIVYAKVGNKVIGTDKADKKGNYSIKIKKQKVGTSVTVYAKDKAGNVSKSLKVNVSK